MENRRQKQRAGDSKSLSKVEKPSSEITFEAFFTKCVFEGKLKSWQKLEIATFFKDAKLKDKEDLEVYEATLGKY